MTFNVLTEPWIPVRNAETGAVTEMGILDVLKNAPALSEITDAMPNYEYGMYRLLFVFLMDACKPKKEADMAKLLENGSFDMDVIETYVSECRKDGECFDLFDEKRPFLQSTDVDKTVKGQTSVAKLNPALPSGNNAPHFDHTFEEERTFLPAEACKALCSINLFCGCDGRGYSAALSADANVIPIYTIIKGTSLFQTLLFGMVPSENFGAPIWRLSRDDIQLLSMGSKILLLPGLLFPSRFVHLIPDQSGSISHMMWSPGIPRQITIHDTKKNRVWTDPYVTYITNDDSVEKAALAQSLKKEYWLDLGAIIGDQSAPRVLRQYRKLDEIGNPHIILYAVTIEKGKASYYLMQRVEHTVSKVITSNGGKCNALANHLLFIDMQGSKLSGMFEALGKELNLIHKEKDKKPHGKMISERTYTLDRYFFRCKQLFFNEFCPRLAETPVEKMQELEEEWKKRIRKICIDEYDALTFRLGDDSRLLIAAQKVKEQFLRKEHTDGK